MRTAAQIIGRRLPSDALFMSVEELFALSDEDREVTEVMVCPGRPGAPQQWVPVDRLLRDNGIRASSLAHTPSGLVLVARRVS